LLSILGHPLLTLPLAVLALIAMREPARLPGIAAGMAMVAVAVMAYSWRQVRRARWAHIDASGPEERAGLNRVLAVVLIALTLLAHMRGLPLLALGLALSAGLILAALALKRWCTLSLHVAFAAYAAGLLWTLSPVAALAGLAFAAGVAWSRLHLARHRPRDVAIGAAAGVAAAVAFTLSLASSASLADTASAAERSALAYAWPGAQA
jgi:hypothetical protein